jgi:hypothetical protein
MMGLYDEEEDNDKVSALPIMRIPKEMRHIMDVFYQGVVGKPTEMSGEGYVLTTLSDVDELKVWFPKPSSPNPDTVIAMRLGTCGDSPCLQLH